jgi:ferric-dicitrate binding protein FerR (iron transport regulator)
MMTCGDLTNDLLTGPLSAAARAHLEGCAACRGRRVELRSIESDLAALGRALPRSANPALVRRILAKIPKRTASGWSWAAGLAAAALLLAVILATRETSEPPPSPRDTVAVPAPPPLETVLDPVPPPPRPEPQNIPPAPEKPAVPAPDPAPTPPLPASTSRPRPEPGTPAPAPVEVPRPPAPATKPARVVLALAAVEGALELQDGDKWKKIAKVADWDEAAALRSGERLARFSLPDGTRATLRPRSELRILSAMPVSLSLERGEAFFEVIPAPDRRFSVVTPDARVRVTGTQFSVRRDGHTEVFVSAGEVVVGNDKGEVSVPAGNATSARKGAAPAKARAADADRASAWRRELDGPEISRFRYDFEDGRLPPLWTSGRVVNFGPARGLNKYCLEGTPGLNADLSRVDKRVWTYRSTLKLRFRYWTSGAESVWIQLFSERVQDNMRIELKHIAANRWETVELPLAEFFRLSDGTHPQEGDRFSWFNISVSGATGPLYFDDIELVESLK